MLMWLLVRLLGQPAFWITAWLIPGFEVEGGFFTYLWVALLFGIVNAVLGPILHLISLPLTIITLGLFALVVNAVVLAAVAGLSDKLDVGGFGWTIVAALAAIVSALLGAVTDRTLAGSGDRGRLPRDVPGRPRLLLPARRPPSRRPPGPGGPHDRRGTTTSRRSSKAAPRTTSSSGIGSVIGAIGPDGLAQVGTAPVRRREHGAGHSRASGDAAAGDRGRSGHRSVGVRWCRGPGRLARPGVRAAHVPLRPERFGQDLRPRPALEQLLLGQPAHGGARPQRRLRADRGAASGRAGRGGAAHRDADVRVLGADSTGAEPLRLRFATMPVHAQAAILRLDGLADRGEYSQFLHLMDRPDLLDVHQIVAHLRQGDRDEQALAQRIENIGLPAWEVWAGANASAAEVVASVPGSPFST